MSRAMLLMGMAGGIIGTIAFPIFVYHIILFSNLYSIGDYIAYLLSSPFIAIRPIPYSMAMLLFFNYLFVVESVWPTFGIVSAMTGIFLFLHVLLISLGFYGIHKATGRTSGMVTFIIGLIVSPVTLILYILILIERLTGPVPYIYSCYYQ
ncbi:MAG: hypothetical protein QXX18_09200 [Candidatus Jordarchaeales archaeon]